MNGIQEGVARALTQMITYPLDAKKTCLQVGQSLEKPYRGIFQSSFLAGTVFATYYHMVHWFAPHPMASPLASFLNSFLKIPIGNCMRVFQTNESHRHVLETGQRMIQKKGFKGLYTGYGMSMLEDVIETTLRDHCYDRCKSKCRFQNIWIGALSGAFGAAMSTPLDSLRTQMAYATLQSTQHPLSLSIPVLYKGIHLRAMSNAIRYGLFYGLLEVMSNGK